MGTRKRLGWILGWREVDWRFSDLFGPIYFQLEVAARVAESDSPSSYFLVWACLGVVFGSYPPPWCLGENSLSSALNLSFGGCLHQGVCRFIPIWWCQIVVSDGVCCFLVLGSCGVVWYFGVLFSGNLLQSLPGSVHGLVWKGTRARVCSLLVLGSLGSFFIGFSSSVCHRWLSLESEESSLVLSGGMCGDFDRFRGPSIALSSLHGGTFWTSPSQLWRCFSWLYSVGAVFFFSCRYPFPSQKGGFTSIRVLPWVNASWC